MSEPDCTDLPDVPVVVLSGPSGSGKTTVVSRLMAKSPVPWVKAISATTRPPRPGETNGVDYYFLSDKEFRARREREDFVECAEVHGSGFWYGTLKSELQRCRELGSWAFLEVDVQGALRIMEVYPNAVTIFLRAPDETQYEQRLRARGTESDATIQRRMQTVTRELALADRYRYQVVNDNLDRTIREISDILLATESEQHA